MSMVAANPNLRIDWVIMSANETRKLEAEKSFAAWFPGLKHAQITFCSFSDSFFPWQGMEIKQELHRLASVCEPDLILTTRRKDMHQDHRLLSELTWNAFRNHLIWEYEIPKYDGDLGNPNLFFPLAEEIARSKIKLLMSHFKTQQSKSWYRPETFESLMRIRGIECNAPSGFSEGFHANKMCLAASS